MYSWFIYVMGGLSVLSLEIQCRTLPGLVSAGFSIIFGALLSKTWRIHRIFNSRTLNSKAPSTRGLLVPGV
jgi:hypothetical protein